MDIAFHFATTDIFLVAGMLALAIVAAFGLRTGWLKRIAVSSYIALAIVLVLPKEIFFSSYADLWFFCGSTLIILFVGHGRLFDTEGGWSEGRIPWKTILLGFFVVGLLLSIVLSFIPATDTKDIVSKSMRDILTTDFWALFWLLAPMVYILIFDRR